MFKKFAAGVLVAGSLFAASANGISMTGPDGAAKSYDTIQAALNDVKSAGDYTIKLEKGTYEEALYYNGPATITISGNTSAKYGSDVVIAKANSGDIVLLAQAGGAQKGRCLFEFDGTGNLILENLTLHNTFKRGQVKGSNTQAEALGFDSTGYVAAYNCNFKSHQDTIRVTGKTWFYKCYVEGDTDYIWMESTGKVALFEECEIVSIFDEKPNDASKVGAPRMTIGTNADKGLVIFNSTITGDAKHKTLLGRTPWAAGYLNQIAVINTKCKFVDPAMWEGSPLNAAGVENTIVGWKVDEATAKSIGVKDLKNRKDILSKDVVKNEFSGRNAILNRYYNGYAFAYKKDVESYWDVDALVKNRGWKVSKDKSSALLKGEVEGARTVYVLDGKADVSALKLNGFAAEGDKGHFAGDAGSTITVPVKGKALVTVKGYYAGSGSISAGKQGEAGFNVNTGSTSAFNEKTYVVYENDASVTIKANEKTYLTSITVVEDNTLTFKPVESIAVTTGKKDIKELAGKKSLTLEPVLTPANATNTDYVWTVSDENAASIDETGVLVAKVVSADTVVKVRATSKDEKKVYGEKEIKILMPEVGAFAVTWLASPEASASLEGVSDDPSIGKGNKAAPSKGTWKYNSSKVPADVAKGGITYTNYAAPTKKDEVYVDFPITAEEAFKLQTVEVAFGNHGTGNVAAIISVDTGSGFKQLIDDDTKTCRSARKTYKFATKNISVEKGKKMTVRVQLYGTSGNSIPTGKAPTVATVTVNGKKL